MLVTVRHGETDYNLKRIYSGRNDWPRLTKEAHDLAYKVGKKLKQDNFDLAIVSPLTRAKETFNEINKTLNIEYMTCEDIVERDYKEYDGKSYDLLDYKNYWRLDLDGEFKIETIKEMIERVEKFLNEIREKYHDKNVLIVSHSGVCRVIRYILTGKKENDLRDYKMDNLEVYKYEEW